MAVSEAQDAATRSRARQWISKRWGRERLRRAFGTLIERTRTARSFGSWGDEMASSLRRSSARTGAALGTDVNVEELELAVEKIERG